MPLRLGMEKAQKTREGCGCPKFLAGKVFGQISTLLENSSPTFRQHKIMLSLPRFGHFPARKTAAGKLAAAAGTLLDFLLWDRQSLLECQWKGGSLTTSFHSADLSKSWTPPSQPRPCSSGASGDSLHGVASFKVEKALFWGVAKGSGGILNSPWNYNSHETTTFGMFQFNLLGSQGGNSREMTTSPPGHYWEVTVLHSQQPPNYNKSKPTAVKRQVRNSTRSMRFCVVSWLLSFQVPLRILWGSSVSWVAKFKGDKIQNASSQMGGREVTRW